MKLYKQIPAAFPDQRGSISMVLDDGSATIKSVLLIRSNKGSVRANHYHKKDSHYCYLVSGAMEYFERPIGAQEIPQPTIVEAGDMVYTPPMVEHAMRFTEDTVFFAFATESRHQDDYESDTVRVKFIDA